MSNTILDPNFRHDAARRLGVLVVNLGTPEAPTPAAVRRYLAEFLWDPRVVDTSRPLWWLMLHGVILRLRPQRSARAYKKVWTDAGSPLLVHSQNQAAAVQNALEGRFPGLTRVELAMRYGKPSVASALANLEHHDVRRLLVLPLYPQYSATTTASVYDAVTRELGKRRWLPELRFINEYHDARGYIAALAASIREHWDTHDRGNHLLFSFHGIPKRFFLSGDPYHCHCQKTARLVAESLELDDDDWTVSFQSRVGRDEWLRPYTDETLIEMGKAGRQSVDVVCPGFSADCLETLEEIAIQDNAFFTEAGGETLAYIPALNTRDDHIAFLTRLIEKHCQGWPEVSVDYTAKDANEMAEKSMRRAKSLGAER